MSRKDEVWQAACRQYAGITHRKAFVQGAAWDDAHPDNRWISVDDALPEVYEPVLAAAGNHFAVVAIRDNFDWYDSKFGGEKISGITNWQRLPAPPKKGE